VKAGAGGKGTSGDAQRQGRPDGVDVSRGDLKRSNCLPSSPKSTWGLHIAPQLSDLEGA